MSSKNPYRDRKIPPPFKAGDLVTPVYGARFYNKWRHGQFRRIEQVIWDETNYPYGHWVLLIYNPMKAHQYGFLNQCSKYNPANFTKESSMPINSENKDDIHTQSYQSNYLIAKVDDCDNAPSLLLETFITSEKDALNHIRQIGKEGEAFFILKTIKRIEVLPPSPPLKITDLR